MLRATKAKVAFGHTSIEVDKLCLFGLVVVRMRIELHHAKTVVACPLKILVNDMSTSTLPMGNHWG